MRKETKNRILDLVKTLFSAHDDIEKLLKKDMTSYAAGLIGDCQDSIISIGEIIQNSEGDGHHTVELIEKYCKELFDFYNALISGEDYGMACKSINKALTDVKKSIEKDIAGKIEVVFMPYKASMWDSLESIWEAANNDPECDAYVVPIPYYDRNPDYSFGEFHYEGNELPDYVPITDYRKYDERKRKPDIIYIHNPYDDCNYVTSVDPRFYSIQLRKNTKCLIYVPYDMYASFAKNNFVLPYAVKNADYFIIQSEKQFDYYVSGGVPENKLLVFGTPKIDYIIKKLKEVEISQCWIDRTENKKVFLINNSISYFLRCEDWGAYIRSIIEMVKNNIDCIFIWRPHPLLRSTVKSMRTSFIDEFDNLVEMMKSQTNVIYDENSSAFMALKCSDGLISDRSSLSYSFFITGKPVLFTEGCEKIKYERIVYLDYFTSSYFINDGVSGDKFIEMIKNGEDYKKEDHLKALNSGFKNMNGTCGEKIHKYIMTKINKQYE